MALSIDLSLNAVIIMEFVNRAMNGQKYKHVPCQAKYIMLWAIWYHLFNLKNLRNTHGGVLRFGSACIVTKSY